MTDSHYVLDYAKHANEMLHHFLMPTWCYRHEIIEIPGVVTALLITYDGVQDDRFEISTEATWADFINRMTIVRSDYWEGFSLETMKEFAAKPKKNYGGLDRANHFFHKRGFKP